MTYEEKFNNLVEMLNHAFNCASCANEMANMRFRLTGEFDNASEIAIDALRPVYLYALDLMNENSESDNEFELPSLDMYETVWHAAKIRAEFIENYNGTETEARLAYTNRLFAHGELIASMFDVSITETCDMVREMVV